jgi:pimeloyl-ACP methyl ester carboxylesterase
MHFIQAGAGAPPLVFVHGFTCAHSDWDPQMAHFAPRHKVLACDLRGHGATPGTPEDVTVETMGGDVAALLATEGLKGAVLVGHSMGCRVVLQAALMAPERVGGVVLVDGSLLGVGDPNTIERDLGAQLRALGFESVVSGMFGQMFVPTSDPRRQQAIIERAKAFPTALGLALFPRMVAWDARNMEHALRTIKAPILALQSTTLNIERQRVPLQPGQSTPLLDALRRLAPSARIEIILGAGHFVNLDEPAVVNRHIEAFIEGRS